MVLSQFLLRSRLQLFKTVENIRKVNSVRQGLQDKLITSSSFINFKSYNTSSSDKKAVAAPETEANVTEYLLKYRKGDEILGFSVQEVTDVPELHLTALRLKHVKTGADYIHVARNDTNNAFCIAFRTPPNDNAGVCHILEHLALCGSEQFPCRDPFMKMLSRSMATFMNAHTSFDQTAYPFSTLNFHDYNNLMRVYLDATFHPKLRRLDFLQEGWRLEHEITEDKNTPIVFKGIVFNEMKGMFSSSAYHFVMSLYRKLYPDTTYAFEHGGDPLAIPTLTHENLVKYHQTYYHPSNAKFYSYGTFPLESHLENVNNYVLSKFDKKELDSSVKPQPKWTSPKEAQIYCAPDPMAPNPDKQTTIAVNYSLSDIRDTNEAFALAIICNLLTDGSTSPFYKSLIESGIGADFAPGSGYGGYTLQSNFAVGLCGIHDNDAEKVKQIIEETFDRVIEEGFPEKRIEAVLHSIELGSKHQTTKFGYGLVMAIAPVWNHEGDPIESMKINKRVDWFRMQLKNDPQFLQKMVKKYFKDNTHKLTLKMNVDPKFKEKEAEKEANLLREKVAKLTENDKTKLYEESLQLAKEQNRVEDVSSLPTLLVAEVEPTIEKTSYIENIIENVPVSAYREATNGIVYFRGIASGNTLPEHLAPYLPIFSSVVTSLGSKRLNYMEQDEEAMLCTGGINASVHLVENPEIANSVEKGLLISSYCLERNTPRMFALWNDIFEQVRFEEIDRLAQLIKIEASDLVQGLTHSGHSYAMKSAGSNLTAGSHLSEMFSGLTRIRHQKTLAELEDFTTVAEKLKDIAVILLSKNVLRCSLHTTPQFHTEGVNFLEQFLSSIPRIEGESLTGFIPEKFSASGIQTHFAMPIGVNFVAKASNTVTYSHPDFANLRILSKLLSRKFLHREIREQGGAYGSGATLNSGGVFTFYSYRDPNVSKTLEAFERGVTWAQNGDFSLIDVDEAKLNVFSEIDHPVTPGDKGLSRFINGVNDEMKQEHKSRIFAANKESLVNVATKYFTNDATKGVTVIGPENDYTKNNNFKIVTE